MPAIELTQADIALFADPDTTRVILPRVTALQRTRTFDQAFVRFEGDQHPTPFRGEGRPRTIPVTCRFLDSEHATAAALIALFEAAQDAPDPRILIRVPVGLVADLNAIEVVTVSEVTETLVDGRAIDVAFTANTVAYTIEV